MARQQPYRRAWKIRSQQQVAAAAFRIKNRNQLLIQLVEWYYSRVLALLLQLCTNLHLHRFLVPVCRTM
jgi:hypothetical protein